MKIQHQFFKKSLTALAIAAALVSASAQASTATINASVTVNNTITMATTPMDLGTISASADGSVAAEVATMVLPSNPATSPTTTNGATGKATMVVLTAGTPATVTVSGAAPSYALTVTLPTTATMTDPAGASTKTFTLGTFTKYATTELNNQSFGTTTDATGALVFNVGATLSTTATGATAANEFYDETTYTGSFDVTVEY